MTSWDDGEAWLMAGRVSDLARGDAEAGARSRLGLENLYLAGARCDLPQRTDMLSELAEAGSNLVCMFGADS